MQQKGCLLNFNMQVNTVHKLVLTLLVSKKIEVEVSVLNPNSS